MDNELQTQINRLNAEIEKIKKSGHIIDHFHNGFDASFVSFDDLTFKKVWIHHTVAGTAAATAANYGTFFICPFNCTITKVKEIHQTAGSDAGAVTLDLEKLTGTTAPDSGVSALASTLSLKATANTVQTATLTTTLGNKNLTIGDRLCLKDTGTLTDVTNVTISVELQITA